jgi:hypothetical protein
MSQRKISYPSRSARLPQRYRVTRAEFDTMQAALKSCRHDVDVQFKRIATMQAEIDHLSVKKTGT